MFILHLHLQAAAGGSVPLSQATSHAVPGNCAVLFCATFSLLLPPDLVQPLPHQYGAERDANQSCPEAERGGGMPEEDRGSLKLGDVLYSYYSICFQITTDAFVPGQQFKTALSGIVACQVPASAEYGRANVPSSLSRG